MCFRAYVGRHVRAMREHWPLNLTALAAAKPVSSLITNSHQLNTIELQCTYVAFFANR